MTETGLRILVIEDHPALARFIAAALTQAGWSVLGPVTDHAAAMEAAQGLTLDLAVMDCVLQGGDTFAVADILDGRGVGVLLMSGYSRTRLPERLRELPFLEKPFALDALLDAVHAATSRPR